MCDMHNQTLPLPNPGDWISIAAAAARLEVSRRTVERLIEDGRLTGYWIEGARGRTAAAILWRADVQRLREALERVRRPR